MRMLLNAYEFILIMYNETQQQVISILKSIQQNYDPPLVRTWVFDYLWRGKTCIIAMIAIRIAGDELARRRRKIEARLRMLKDVNVTTLLDGEYIKYVIEA